MRKDSSCRSPKQITNIEKLYPQFRIPGDPYTKYMYVSQALVYNKELVKEEPTSWTVMWEGSTRARLRSPDIGTSHGAFFLLTAADMAGGNVKNVDPGFELLKKLKPSILTFYTQHAQMAQLFTQGDVAMASWTSDRAQAAIDGGAPLGWTIPEGERLHHRLDDWYRKRHEEARSRHSDTSTLSLARKRRLPMRGTPTLPRQYGRVKLPSEVAEKLPVADVPRV